MEQQYTLVPTHIFNRIVKVLDKVEPLILPETEKWVSLPKAAELLGCSLDTLARRRKLGLFTERTRGSRKGVTISVKSIKEFQESNTSK